MLEPTPPDLLGFKQDCVIVLSSLRDAMATLFKSAPTPITRAIDLQRALGLRAQLAWQVFRVTSAEEPLAAVVHIPQAHAMGKVLAAARREGFPEAVICEVEKRHQDFESLIARHAGNRATFDTMVAGIAGEETEKIDLKHRRAGFRASAQAWGFQIRTLYLSCIYYIPAEKPEQYNSVLIRGMIGLHPLRHVPTIAVGPRQMRVTRGSSASMEGEALLLEEFSSRNLRELLSNQNPDSPSHCLHIPGIGLRADVDVFMKFDATDVARNNSENDKSDQPSSLSASHLCAVPTEIRILDLLFPAGLYDPKSREVTVYGCLEDVNHAATRLPHLRIPSNDRSEYLGRSIDAMLDPRFPRCPELTRYLLRELGQSRADFDIYRCVTAYPTMHQYQVLSVGE